MHGYNESHHYVRNWQRKYMGGGSFFVWSKARSPEGMFSGDCESSCPYMKSQENAMLRRQVGFYSSSAWMMTNKILEKYDSIHRLMYITGVDVWMHVGLRWHLGLSLEGASPARAAASFCTMIRMAGVCDRTENTMLLTSGSGDYLEYARFLTMITKFLTHSSFKTVSQSLFSLIRPSPGECWWWLVVYVQWVCHRRWGGGETQFSWQRARIPIAGSKVSC